MLLAAAPPALALVLLLARVDAVAAAAAALACGVGVTLLAFPVPASRLVAAEGAALLTAVEVALIVLGGVLLFELMALAGAHEWLGRWVAALVEDPGRRILLVVLGVTPFAESVTGFGVGVIVAAPILLQMGFPPARAALLALLGLVAVPWGALAPGTLVASRLADVPFDQLGVASAVLSGPVFLIVGVAALAASVGPRAVLQRAPDLGLAVGALWGGIWGANLLLGTALAGVFGSLAATGAMLALARLREGRPLAWDAGVRRALRPYALLVVLLLGSRLIAGLAGWQGAARDVALSPALWLFVTAAGTPVLLGVPGAGVPGALSRGEARWRPVALTTLIFLALGALMTVTGMSAVLARAGARLGDAYLLLAPWIGGLGGFLTGSNAGANAMFAGAQADAARQLAYPLDRLLAIQNVSASLLTMASAPRVALAVGLLGPHAGVGGVLRAVLGIDVAVLAVLGAVAWALA